MKSSVIPVTSMQIVARTASPVPSQRQKKVAAATWSTTVNAPDAARRNTVFRKSPWIRVYVGSMDSRKVGIPTEHTPITVSWIGTKGYPLPVIRQNSVSTTEKIVFTRKSEAELWMLLMTRRPSRTIYGMDAKLESSSTRLEQSFAASLPAAMATLQSASFRASTSLTPSPVIATVCPFFFKACTMDFFCSGVTRPKTEYRPQHRGVDIGFPSGKPRLPGDAGNRRRVVAGDHHEPHVLTSEKVQRLFGIRPHHVAQKDQRTGLKPRRQPIFPGQFRRPRNRQHPDPLLGIFFNLLRQQGISLREQEFVSPHQVCPLFPEGSPAELPGRRKGKHCRSRCLNRREPLPQRHRRRIFIRKRPVEHSHDLLQRKIRLQQHGIFYRHPPFRQRAGLVQAQHIHPCQRFDAEKLVHQCLPPPQIDHTYRQRNADQQHQPLRNHPQHRSHRVDNGLGIRHPALEPLAAEKPDPQRHDQDADHFQDHVHCVLQLGAVLFQGLRFLHQLVGEILLPDVLRLRGGVSRHYKAAGIEFIPGIFHDHVGFAGEKRLVYLQRPFPDHSIGADLVPCR